ncbi:MAG: 2-phospho-L-lactate guanylyltransferase [Streptosporangiales bacterium]|nr:2-phospho-L-lactate guanylyltransferase [Streptosporangiales bacterium]
MGCWALVVPVKPLALAKSRLAEVAGERRADLALAMAADTVEAALRPEPVATVVAVTDDDRAAKLLGDLGALVVADEPDAGLNPALRHGAAIAREHAPDVGALSADLPALRPGVLEAVLDAASAHPHAFVPDLAGSGTTLYTATAGHAFEPRFGVDSAARHSESGGVSLASAAAAPLRRDVDTGADLLAAVALGVGPRTRTLVRELGIA